jgi:hypothetical protein
MASCVARRRDHPAEIRDNEGDAAELPERHAAAEPDLQRPQRPVLFGVWDRSLQKMDEPDEPVSGSALIASGPPPVHLAPKLWWAM